MTYMDSEDGNVTVSVRYRPGNLIDRPPIRVEVDGGRTFSLDNEGVKRLSLSPGKHDFRFRCRLRRKKFTVDVESPTRITVDFCKSCGKLTAKASAVSSVDELDYERIGY